MKLSTESIVAAAVAIAFAGLSIGAVAREQSSGGPASTNSPGLTHVSAGGSNSSLPASHTESEILGVY
jgi:hypothetical protein